MQMSRATLLDQMVRSEPFRVFQILLGILLIPVAGIIGIVSPAPIGIVVLGAGLALVLRNSRWARRRYLFHTRRYPRVRRAVDIGMMRRRRRAVAPPHAPPLVAVPPAAPPPIEMREGGTA